MRSAKLKNCNIEEVRGENRDQYEGNMKTSKAGNDR